MKLRKTLSAVVDVLTPLTRPGHAYTRRSQLARRGDVTEDKLGRMLAELAEDFGDPVEFQGRRLVLTHGGSRLLDKLKAVLAVGKELTEFEPTEVLRVAVAEIDPGLLAVAAQAYFRNWEGLQALQFVPLDLQTITESIRSGHVAFAVGLEGDEIVGEGEWFEPGFLWTACIPGDYTMAGLEGRVSTEQLAGCRLVLPPSALRSPRLSDLLTRTPISQQVHVESSHSALAMATAGLGIALVLDTGNNLVPGSVPYRRLPVAGIEPEHLCLYHPGKSDDISQPGRDLIEAIRNAVRDAALPPIPSLDGPEEIEGLPELPPLPEPLSPEPLKPHQSENQV
jgi:DNA-binding transcriptional LysR family regulator